MIHVQCMSCVLSIWLQPSLFCTGYTQVSVHVLSILSFWLQPSFCCTQYTQVSVHVLSNFKVQFFYSFRPEKGHSLQCISVEISLYLSDDILVLFFLTNFEYFKRKIQKQVFDPIYNSFLFYWIKRAFIISLL